MTDKHTAEPWDYNKDLFLRAPNMEGYAEYMIGQILCGYKGRGRANARRIVAAVNASAGIGTESLEAGGITDMMHNIARQESIISDLTSALAKLKGGVMYLGEVENPSGPGLVSKFQCDTCGGEYTICPPLKDEAERDGWQNCMADSCASYDANRDADILFMSDKEIAREKSVVSLKQLRDRGRVRRGEPL